ncbi:MAG TPA: SDR family NAD(P)-dependent oxidoreductase [Terriglobales bacterium]|nr:SDR family NAD(P)-dependent oxidoreductase [Terriglobales bacterium]
MFSDKDFRSRYGPWALVAGGSTGMGAAYSRQLARKGLNVVLLADSAEPLQTLAQSLAVEYGVQTRSLLVDLAAPDLLTLVHAETRELEIGLVVYNAAHSVVGKFLEVSLADKLKMVEVNCRGPVILAHHFGERMRERRRGGLIIVSSLAGFQGQAMVGTYAATKAFDLVIGEALWEEFRDHGVDVLAFCPGATRTPTFLATRPRPAGVTVPLMDPEDAVAEALAALGAKPTHVAGRPNRLAAFVLHRLMPRRRSIELMSRTTRAMYEQR